MNKNYKLLLVDDNKQVRDIILESFNERGIHLDLAASAIEALKLNLSEYQFIITDYAMLDMNGLDFLIEMRKKMIPARIILFSSSLVSLSNEIKSQFEICFGKLEATQMVEYAAKFCV